MDLVCIWMGRIDIIDISHHGYDYDYESNIWRWEAACSLYGGTEPNRAVFGWKAEEDSERTGERTGES